MQYLDPTQKQNVAYCIPEWLRDEQIKQNIVTVKDRLEPYPDKRPEPIAVVCFGPSLNETWEQIKSFQFIITCSGAHKFLIDKGIIPSWHAEVDPRIHKVELLGPPHPNCEYLIASTCHPGYIDHLLKHNARVKLWHVFDNSEAGARMLPAGEWAVTGGCSVELRSMTLAAFLGFRDLHVFGMDGSAGKSGQHAAPHPNQTKKYALCQYNGVTYETTPGMLEAARQTWHELNQMPAVKATFYGDGLVQAMAKDYVPKPIDTKGKTFANVIGFTKPELISAEYAALNAQLHKENLAYGVGGGKHAKTVLQLAQNLKTTSILDYGCGKGYLAKSLPFPIWEYDPAIPEKSECPRPADLVIATDVLEHIEPDKLNYVLDDLKRCVRKLGYFVIHTGPATKTLPDGRNTHLIQQDKEWWSSRISQFFKITEKSIISQGPLLHVIVTTK